MDREKLTAIAEWVTRPPMARIPGLRAQFGLSDTDEQTVMTALTDAGIIRQIEEHGRPRIEILVSQRDLNEHLDRLVQAAA